MQLYTYKLSALEWTPVDFKLVGGEFEMLKEFYSFTNGMSFNLFPFLSGVQDINFNNKTGLVLAGLNLNGGIIKDKQKPAKTKKLTSINTILTDATGNVYKHYSIFNNLSGLETRGTPRFTIEDQITFYFEEDYVYIEDYYGKILTNGGLGESQLYFSEKTRPFTEFQKWNYLLGDGIIMIFSYNNNFGNIILKNDRNRLVLSDYTKNSNNVAITNASWLYLRSYKDFNEFSSLREYQSLQDSTPVRYNVNPLIDDKQDLILDDTLMRVQGRTVSYYQNYLGIFPYEHLNPDNTYDFYFHGLKNYQTYDYRYNNKGDQLNRNYYRIYSGTNQNKGNNKVYLDYITDTVSLKFPSDQTTEFYFSPTMDEIPIQASNFYQNGAFAGQFPYTSDRIYTKKDSNFKDIPQLDLIVKPAHDKDVQYLCTWLYDDGTNATPKWYDRFYNAAKYTQNAALTSSLMLYQDEIYPTENLVFDKQSTLKLSPGILYKYHHIGQKDALNFINDLNFTLNETTNKIENSNVLNISSWDSVILKDHSFYNNYGLTFGNSGNFFGDYWSLDGTNYAIFQANNSLLPDKNLTISFWLNFDDWSNINANQIFGNYYESGFGLFNVSKAISPLFTVIDNQSKTIYNFNSQFKEASKIKSILNEASIVQRMPDLSYWVFDTKNSIGVKYDVNNSVISKDPRTGLTGSIKIPFVGIDQIEIDASENLYIYNNKEKGYIRIDKNGGSTTQIQPVVQTANRIEIDLDGNVLDGLAGRLGVYGNCSVVDNKNVLWQVIGPNLYKGSRIIGTVGASNEMSCDDYNNIWIIGEDDSYTKIDNDGNFVFRYSFKKTPLANATNCPPSPPPIPPTIPVLEEELPFLSTNDLRYIITLPDYYTILVTPPKPKPRDPVEPIIKRKRAINFINGPEFNFPNDVRTSICGLSSVEIDKMVMVDLNDSQAYIINQLGQLELKLNFEILNEEGYKKVDFRTGGDFTGYQYNRKYKSHLNIKNQFTDPNVPAPKSIFAWRWQTKYVDPTNPTTDYGELPNELLFNVTDLAPGWHHFCITMALEQPRTIAKTAVYIDTIEYISQRGSILPAGVSEQISYKYRTSLILGATTIKNTLLNNFLNIEEGYKMIGKIADLKMYNYAITRQDVRQLYISSKFGTKIPELVWNMKTGERNYVEEVSEWFKFHLPTHKTKYYNLNIHNLNIEDKLKKPIETALKNVIQKFSPAHTDLYKINWLLPSKSKKNPAKAVEESSPIELCPNRVTVIQICNSNAAIDDNFDVYLNGTFIGSVVLNQNARIGSYFIGSTAQDYILAEPDFPCSLSDMQKYQFNETLISKTQGNELQLRNTSSNRNGNFGSIQIRSYLKGLNNTLISPSPIIDLNFAGASGSDFFFNFDFICP